MKRRKLVFLLAALMAMSPVAHADLFGGDVAVLAQILAEDIQQLIQLENILSTGKDNIDLLREINRGINDSLALMRTVSPYVNAGMYGDLKNVPDVIRKLSAIYGTPVNSPDAESQQSVDTAVAEAVTMNSAIYDYTAEIDKIGEQIKANSHEVSPGGAAKLTAESLGVMLHVMNQQLRAQGTMLKLQAQGLAQSNKREKDHTADFLQSATTISDAMKASNPQFERPRF